ncbi:helix-turn-helix transcriptional regulator [Sphaerisporangium sp. TRM90804]|uniref:helix-turn-helix transcriptional regulator n=1 Tax=Sphaerisporangium sp. TRM90804 TaxID=3031113 RepID=UPI002446FB15|nr:helix-turn-helix transcriptional regulator [Sphaerisporangium sp. TRM90804]MDH2430511.1 helix-turn-helix transcriptional regulator [Sphaerisporangium sp. TRM90804]
MRQPRSELSEFLRSRRARLSPEETPLLYTGGRRRVPGLRREEIAQLAGMSVDYYTRLEQGKLRNVSESVLEAVAGALRLDETERTYLYQLATVTSRRPRTTKQQQRVRPSVRWLLDGITGAPAYILGRGTDVLAWNPLASALLMVDLEKLSPEKRNMARLVFLDENARDLWQPWETKARDIVGGLRMHASLYREDPQLANLVGELSVKSPEFRLMWAAHQVWTVPHGKMNFQHPIVGELNLTFDAFGVPDTDQSLISYTAEPGSKSAVGLQILASWYSASQKDLQSVTGGDARSSVDAADEPPAGTI